MTLVSTATGASTATAVVAVVAVALVSYLFRSAPLLARLSPRVEAIVEQVAPHLTAAAFTALGVAALPPLLDGDPALAVARSTAVVAAVVAAWWRRSPVAGLAAGIAVLVVGAGAVALVP